MSTNMKRWIISTLITFIAGFAAALLVDINSITLETIQNGSIYGIIFVAVRSGVKSVLELVLSYKAK